MFGKKRRLEASEQDECIAYYDWAKWNKTVAPYLIKHVNEGKRSHMMGFILKLMGMRPGLPDYQLPLANDKYIGLWIEMKKTTERDKVQKPEQISWINRLCKAGHYATFCFGADEAIQVTKDYLNNKL